MWRRALGMLLPVAGAAGTAAGAAVVAAAGTTAGVAVVGAAGTAAVVTTAGAAVVGAAGTAAVTGAACTPGAVRLGALCMLLLVAGTAAAGAAAVAGAARTPGAVRLGALFAVHGAPAAAAAGGATCGRVREHYGIQRVEATLQALDRIAAAPELLPGLPLGAELRDSCWAPPTALRQTIDLVRDAIAPPHARAHPDPGTCLHDGGSAASAPLVGVLGPGASAAAAQVQNLLQLFAIPQVSYSATARELSDRARYATFYRVVPSDRHQARLLSALLQAHNWTYVHAVHTDESYGASGMAVFREEAARGGVCVSRGEALRAAPAPHEVDAALARLLAPSGGTSVAVCWCEGRTARALLAGLARRGGGPGGPRLRLVASDGWADRGDVVAGLEAAAEGSLTVRIRSPYLHHFDHYYHKLTPRNNHRNPWFKEFWEQKFNCSLSDDASDEIRKCNGSESLGGSGYTQEPKLALVVRGVYALAHALHDMREALCPPAAAAGPAAPPPRPALCAAMLPFNVSLYRRYLSRVRFRAPDGGLVAFDENGDPPPELSEYDVMSLMRAGGGGGWRYARVGVWRGGRLRLRGGEGAAAARAAGWAARCSAPCRPGWFARGGRCCWSCVPCPPLAVTRASAAGGRARCVLCPPGTRPDAMRTACAASPLEWGGAGAGAAWARHGARAAGATGLAAVGVTGGVLWRHRATPVVKSASRELSALLLGAAALCHAAALAGAARPGLASCGAVRLAAPALAGVYAALLLRTARVARLVAARGARPRGVSARAVVSGWAALSAPGAAGALCAAWAWPAWPRVLHPGRARSVLACGGEGALPQLAPLAPALLLLLACTALAVRTRRLPHNFNETRFIGAAAYATCVTWLAFLPLYAAAEARTAALGGCVSASAGGAVLLALGPRVYVCVWRPQRNTRAHFLTASIRCHLGKYRPAAAAGDAQHVVTTREAACQAGARGGRCARVTERRCAGAGDDTLTVQIALCRLHHCRDTDSE